MPDIDVNLKRNGNHLYFYDVINDQTSLGLISALLEVDADLNGRYDHIYSDERIPIWLHIYSGGGQVFLSFAIIDQIKRLQSPVYSVVEGVCASAATVLSMGCARRYIMPNAFMMIHQVSSLMWGTVSQMEDDLYISSMLMEKLIAFYKGHTHLRRKDIRHLLKRDSWFDATQCVELGFADAIL